MVGEYSDTMVDAVFDTRERALEYCRNSTYPGYIMDTELNPTFEKSTKPHPLCKTYDIDEDLNITCDDEIEVWDECGDPGFIHFIIPYRSDQVKRLILRWSFDVEKYSDEKARKVLAEKAAQLKVAGLWGNNEACNGLFRNKKTRR